MSNAYGIGEKRGPAGIARRMAVVTSLGVRRLLAALLAVGALGPVGTAAAQVSPPPRTNPPEGADYERAYIRSEDGTKLHADVLKPKGLAPGQRTPVLMVVTPYGAHSFNGTFAPPDPTRPPPSALFVTTAKYLRAWERGYTVVIVDVRGFGGSEGCWDNYGPGEQQDVKASVEWAHSQPWSTGKVALIGGSYDGATALMGLVTRPVGLAAVVSLAPVVDVYRLLYTGGVPTWWQALYPWYGTYITNQPGSVYDAVDDPQYWENWAGRLRPECQGAQAREIQDANGDSPYWRTRDLLERAARSNVPVWGWQGFLDANVPPDQLLSLYPHLRNPRGLWLGQSVHDAPVSPGGADRIGRGAAEEIGRFLDEALLGKRPSVEDPAVVVQEAPDLVWRTEAKWPPRDAEPFELPLLSGSYRDTSGNFSGDHFNSYPVGALPDQANGQGTWSFSEPLPHSIHLAGFPRLRASAAGPSRARLIALLYDVNPDGKAYLITRGATLLRDGKVDIELQPQDWRLKPGHRLGVLISGADESWWKAGVGTAAEVEVEAAGLSLPLLRCSRSRLLGAEDGWNKGKSWGQEEVGEDGVKVGGVKRAISIDRATIDHRTTVAEHPAPQASGGACTPIG